MKIQTKLLTLLTIVALAVIGAYAWRVLPSFLRGPTPAPAEVAPQPPRVLPTDQVRGASGATKTVIEFGDLECPYCAAADRQLAGLVEQQPGVRLVWKDCPLPSHPNAQKAAEAALCAGDQGKYWAYHDLLIQNNDQLGPEIYSTIANALKLDAARFGNCLSANAKRTQVLNSLSECALAGVEELPWFSLNEKSFSGSGAVSNLINELNNK